MKRLVLICILLLAAISSQADNISVTGKTQDGYWTNDVILKGYATTTVSVNLANTATNITGFQMDITLPEGVEPILEGDSLALTEGYRLQGTYLLKGKKTTGNTYRVAYLSTSRTAISYTSGNLFSLQLKNSTATDGTYKCSIKNIVLACNDGSEQKLGDVTFNVTVSSFTKEGLEEEIEDLMNSVLAGQTALAAEYQEICKMWKASFNVFGNLYFQRSSAEAEAALQNFGDRLKANDMYTEIHDESKKIAEECYELIGELQSATTQSEYTTFYEKMAKIKGDANDWIAVKHNDVESFMVWFDFLSEDLEQYEKEPVHFPDPSKYWSIAPVDAQPGLQMGYKSQCGFVLTSAGRMMFEQVKDNTFLLKDTEGHYVVLNADKSIKA